MYLHDLEKANPITLEIYRKDLCLKLKTKITSSMNNGITIKEIPHKGKPLLLEEQDEVYVFFIKNQTLLRWKIESWLHETQQGFATISLISSAAGENYNRRDAFRVSSSLPSTAINDRKMKQKILILNVSAIGISFVSEEPFDIGETLTSTIEDLGYTIPLELKINRKEITDKKYVYGALIENQPVYLLRYIHDVQREEMKKNRFKP